LSRGRLEAFSDGVLAIVMTIMVLELRPPEGTSLDSLVALWPKFLAYALSFVYLGIYWVNHHHLLHAVSRVNGTVLWSNLNLLFWLSLVPFGTAWMGETEFASVPVAVYAALLLMPAIAYGILVQALLRVPDQPASFAQGIGRDIKGSVSIALYVLAVPLAIVFVPAAIAIFVIVGAIWIVPDRRLAGRAVD
jgi:TMEM175 potassium channel family protein